MKFQTEYRGWNFLKIPLNRFSLNSIFVHILGERGRETRDFPLEIFWKRAMNRRSTLLESLRDSWR